MKHFYLPFFKMAIRVTEINGEKFVSGKDIAVLIEKIDDQMSWDGFLDQPGFVDELGALLKEIKGGE